MIDPYLHSNNNSMHNSAFQNFLIAPGSMMGGPQGFMNPRDYGIMQSQYGGATMGLGSSPYGYMYDNPIISKFAMETGIMSRPTGTNYAVTAMHQGNVNTMVAGTFMAGGVSTAGGLGGMTAGAMAGTAMAGPLGGLVGAIAGGMLGEGAVSPLTDVLNRRTMEKMSIHQALGGLANNDSPYGGGFGFSRKAAQSLYQNMEEISTKDVSFTTGEMTMMLSEGINSGEITGNTVSELNKKLEKTKETIKALSQITGNSKIGELNDMIRQMVTVGFDSSAVTEVTHGITFAARRLGQNPDDYRNQLVQNAQNAERYGGANAAQTIMSEPLADSTLANSDIYKSLGNKDSVKRETRELFEWSERNINNNNIRGMNIAGISSEVQRSFIADSFAREQFGKDNETELQKRMETGVTRGQALSTMWAMSSKETKMDYAEFGSKASEKSIREVGITGTMDNIGIKAPDLYSSNTALRIHSRDKETMRKESVLFTPILAEFLGADKILKDRVDQAGAMSAIGAQYGLMETLGQGGESVLGSLQEAFKTGKIEDQKRLQEADLRAGRVFENKRNNTIMANAKKGINWLSAKTGKFFDMFTPPDEAEVEEGTGQVLLSKIFHGENKKLFINKNTTPADMREDLDRLREGTDNGSIWLDRTSGQNLDKMRYVGNNAPVAMFDKNKKRPRIEGDIENAALEITRDYSLTGNRIAANEALAMFSSGGQRNKYTNKLLGEAESDIKAYQAGEISSKEYKSRDKERFEDTIKELKYVSEAINSGASLEEISENMGDKAKALIGIYPLDKNIERVKQRTAAKQSPGRNIADYAIDTITDAEISTSGATENLINSIPESERMADGELPVRPGAGKRDTGFTLTRGVGTSAEDKMGAPSTQKTSIFGPGSIIDKKDVEKDTAQKLIKRITFTPEERRNLPDDVDADNVTGIYSFGSTGERKPSIFDDGSIVDKKDVKEDTTKQKEGLGLSREDISGLEPGQDPSKFTEVIEFGGKKDASGTIKEGKEDKKKKDDEFRLKKMRTEAIKYSPGKLNTFFKIMGIDKKDLSIKETDEVVGMLMKGDFTEGMKGKFELSDHGEGEDGEERSAREMQRNIARDVKRGGNYAILGDSSQAGKWGHVNPYADKSKLQIESSSNKELSDAIESYSVMDDKEKTIVFDASKKIGAIRAGLDKRGGTDLSNELLTSLKIGDLGLTPEQLSVATEISRTTAGKESKNIEELNEKVSKFSGVDDMKRTLGKVWDVDLSTKEAAGAAQALHSILTQENEGTDQRGMSDIQVKSLLVDKKGNLKDEDVLNSDPTSKAALAVLKDVATEKGKDYKEYAKIISSREMGEGLLDRMDAGGRDMGAMHAAVNGGPTSTDTVVGVLNRILTAIEKLGLPGGEKRTGNPVGAEPGT